jgi:hypothetical protein
VEVQILSSAPTSFLFRKLRNQRGLANELLTSVSREERVAAWRSVHPKFTLWR